jgi:cytochrome c oxidase subunit IV
MATMTDPRTDEYNGPALGAAHGGHPSDLQYIGVAVVLAIFTAVEVALSYVIDPGGPQTVALLVLALIKFVIVALYFMHLKFDPKTFRTLFTTGFVLASFCYIAVLTISHFWTR